MTSTIVVPLDGSDFSEKALPVADLVARRLGVPLTLLTSGWGSTVDELERYLNAEATSLSGTATTVVVPDTFPATAISQTLEGRDAIVVMATHGRSGIGKAILGSVAEDVLRGTDRPLMLVGPGGDPAAALGGGPLVVSTDGSETSASVVPWAATWAKALGLQVRLVTVTRADGTPLGTEDAAELEARLASMADALRAEGLEVEVETLTGNDAASALVDLANNLPAGLLAMATHGRTGLARTALGSTAMKVVHDARCPVLVHRPER